MRRLTFIALALMVLGFASSASAQYGQHTVSQKVDLYLQDSVGILNLPLTDSLINDTIIYLSPPFNSNGSYSHLSVRFVQTVRDTATETGFAADSILFQLQTKAVAESASVWYTIGSTVLAPVASFDTVGGWIEGDAGRILITASDSSASLAGQFRIRTVYIAEEDSIRSHCTLRSSSRIDPYAAFVAEAVFSDFSGPEPLGIATQIVDIDFPAFDSTTVLVANGLATSQINDSIWFFTPEFYINRPWSNMVCDFVVLIKDTTTATQLCRDSVLIKLETRIKNDSIKIWNVIGATTKWPLAAWDSTGLATTATIFTASGKLTPQKNYPSATSLYTGAATGIGGPYRGIPSAQIRVADADSVGAEGQTFRFAILYSAEEDSLKSHLTLRTGTSIDILDKLRAIIKYRVR